MTAYVLAHLSDPHLPPLPAARLHELIGKRALGYLNWQRNRHTIHRRELLDLLVSDLHTQQPDHVAITGDLLNLALPAEFAPARKWLENVGPPERVTVIPGNHDAYVRATQHRFAEAFGDYLRGDGANATDAIVFPYVQRRGPLTLIATSTAVPTAPFMATGWLGPSQLDVLDRGFSQLADDPNFRVLLIHHPLSSKASYKRLTDAEALQAIIRRHRVDLILHGHDHIHSTMWFEGPHGRVPAIGVPSASATAYRHYPPAAYNLFSIAREDDAWRCEQRVRGFADGAAAERAEVTELQRVQLI